MALGENFAVETEDPRLNNPEKTKKRKKSSGVGRNTVSFDPHSTLVRPELRILIGNKDKSFRESNKKNQWESHKHDDVLVIPNFFCEEDDWTIYNQLIKEMREEQQKNTKGSEWISWHEGAHLISKNPKGSPTFNTILKKAYDYFDLLNNNTVSVDTIGTRFNWYRDPSDWKPLHHDSAAFNPERAKNQNITIGFSFGVTRELSFYHAKNDTKIYFPQTNGMLFAFGRDGK